MGTGDFTMTRWYIVTGDAGLCVICSTSFRNTQFVFDVSLPQVIVRLFLKFFEGPSPCTDKTNEHLGGGGDGGGVLPMIVYGMRTLHGTFLCASLFGLRPKGLFW